MFEYYSSMEKYVQCSGYWGRFLGLWTEQWGLLTKIPTFLSIELLILNCNIYRGCLRTPIDLNPCLGHRGSHDHFNCWMVASKEGHLLFFSKVKYKGLPLPPWNRLIVVQTVRQTLITFLNSRFVDAVQWRHIKWIFGHTTKKGSPVTCLVVRCFATFGKLSPYYGNSLNEHLGVKMSYPLPHDSKIGYLLTT